MRKQRSVARDECEHPAIVPVERDRPASVEGNAAHAAFLFRELLFHSWGERSASAHARSLRSTALHRHNVGSACASGICFSYALACPRRYAAERRAVSFAREAGPRFPIQLSTREASELRRRSTKYYVAVFSGRARQNHPDGRRRIGKQQNCHATVPDAMSCRSGVNGSFRNV
jgi:hypothetical protein